jgi:hypothetical protein
MWFSICIHTCLNKFYYRGREDATKRKCGCNDNDDGEDDDENAVAHNYLNGLLKKVTRLLIHLVIC